MSDSTLPLVSVVVIGRNEGPRLQRCLQSIAQMNHPSFDFEVIYVDSGSADNSLTLAKESGATVIALRPDRPTAALGRNAGWHAANGSIILFLDGDTILQPDFVANSLPDLARENIAIVWGHRREIHPEHSLYNRVLDLDWIYAPGPTLYCGGDALFRRNVLDATNGFDETLIAGEEPELCRRIAALDYTILHVDRPMTGHDLAITRFSQYWKRNIRAGHAFAEVSERRRTDALAFWTYEATRNRNRALTLSTIFFAGVALSIVFLKLWPAIIMLVFFAVISLRSAYKARWKTTDKVALLLYGIHSHLQQIPIYWGQLQYKLNHRRGKRAGLVEYKQP
jgi:cellulose synthase/poly-beta-1,6-N-acetylglucosamine synthase-like glycosyltransferase